MNNRYQIGMESYDRLFPNQDTLPKGGFGNLIALPFKGDRVNKETVSLLMSTLSPMLINGVYYPNWTRWAKTR